jgi:hypothetical protein
VVVAIVRVAGVLGEVTSTDREGNSSSDEVVTLREVYLVLNPDAASGSGNQTKEHDCKPIEHSNWNRSVTLRAVKGLARGATRCFAALRVIGLVLSINKDLSCPFKSMPYII